MIGGLIIIFIIFARLSSNGQSEKVDKFAALKYPSQEMSLINASNTALSYSGSKFSDMQKGKALNERNKEICRSISFTAQNWVGIISKIGTNSDGYGYLYAEIADNISIETWNNSLSDTFYNTLINPNSKLFNTLVDMKVGQPIKFSGMFFPDSQTCISEKSITLDGKIGSPSYLFKFSSLTAIK